MNNNQMNFDPTTGQPINNQNNTTGLEQPQIVTVDDSNNVQPLPQIVTVDDSNNVQPLPQGVTVDDSINTQQQLQNIPTVEQSQQSFINSVQATNIEKKEDNKNKPNILFIIILFIIIFASIFFLFPFLFKTL